MISMTSSNSELIAALREWADDEEVIHSEAADRLEAVDQARETLRTSELMRAQRPSETTP